MTLRAVINEYMHKKRHFAMEEWFGDGIYFMNVQSSQANNANIYTEATIHRIQCIYVPILYIVQGVQKLFFRIFTAHRWV